jgi:hypothetical protein
MIYICMINICNIYGQINSQFINILHYIIIFIYGIVRVINH